MSSKKQVRLQIGNRKKVICLEENDGPNDFERLLKSFEHLVQRDHVVSELVSGRNIIFRIENTLFNEDVDVDECTIIEHGAKLSCEMEDVFADSGLGRHKQLTAEAICVEGRIKQEQTPYRSTEGTSNSPSFSERSGVIISLEDMFQATPMESQTQNVQVSDSFPTSVAMDSTISVVPHQQPPFNQKKLAQQKRMNTPQLSAPILSNAIKTAIREGTIHTRSLYKKFIGECVAHLVDIVPGPKRNHYKEYAEIVADVYPFIRDSNNGLLTFRSNIAHRHRNRNYHCRKGNRAYNKSSHSAKNSDVTHSCAQVDRQNDDVYEFINELQEIFSRTNIFSCSDKIHITELMKNTFVTRREDVGTGMSIKELVDKYPAITNEIWLLDDFNSLTNTTIEQRKQNFVEMVKKAKNLRGTYSVNDTDVNILNILMWVNGQVITGKRKGCPIVLLRPDDGFPETCPPNTSAFCQIQLGNYNQIVRAAIFTDGVMLLTIDTMTTFNIVDCLLACYYLTDNTYPKEYMNFLLLLQESVLGFPLKPNELKVASRNLILFLKRMKAHLL